MLPNTAISKHSRARAHTPPERRCHLRDLNQSTRGLKHKIPPRDAIAYATLTKALGGSSIKSPRKRRYRHSSDFHQSTRGLKHKIPPRDAITTYASSP